MWIGLTLLLPVVAILITALPVRAAVAGTAAALLAALNVAVAVTIAVQLAAHSPVTLVPGWLAIDSFGGIVLLLETFGALTALLFSVGYLKSPHISDRRRKRYLLWLHLFLLALYAIPLLNELALVWLALTLTTLFSVFLVSFERTPAALEAGWKYALLTTLGAALALLGMLLLYWALTRAGGSDFTWHGLTRAAGKMPVSIVSLAFLLMLVGFGTKAALIPFHAWLPDAYSQAPFPVCAMLSILESVAIPYVILRLVGTLGAVHGSHAPQWLLAFGLVSAGGAALLILQTHEYKRLFAYSTIENTGIILTAGAMTSSHVKQAALWQMIAHGFTKPVVFLAAGIMFMLVGKLRISEVRGVLSKSWVIGSVVMLAGLALAGAPPFAIFLSELAILKNGMMGGQAWVVMLLAAFMIVSFCAITYHLFRMVLGRTPEDSARDRPVIALACRWALVLALVPVLVLGWWMPPFLHHLITGGAAALGGTSP
ncbi:MAG: hypothetical protein HKL95_06100 [Phycisphaerae bacterium]|nr:hypothetical protein [Phycisphaerae bacterium]